MGFLVKCYHEHCRNDTYGNPRFTGMLSSPEEMQVAFLLEKNAYLFGMCKIFHRPLCEFFSGPFAKRKMYTLQLLVLATLCAYANSGSTFTSLHIKRVYANTGISCPTCLHHISLCVPGLVHIFIPLVLWCMDVGQGTYMHTPDLYQKNKWNAI